MIRPQPKPVLRRTLKARANRAAAVARRRCEIAVWARDREHCLHCGARVYRASTVAAQVGHVHEWPMRSKGNDGTDPRFCLLLCGACHLRGTHGWPRLEPVYADPACGAEGGVSWAWRTTKVEGERTWKR